MRNSCVRTLNTGNMFQSGIPVLFCILSEHRYCNMAIILEDVRGPAPEPWHMSTPGERSEPQPSEARHPPPSEARQCEIH